MSDIVDRLRGTAYALPGDWSSGDVRNDCTEAADEIERLRAALAAGEARPAAGWRMVPVEPSPEHLDSIALRYDHSFGLLPPHQQNNIRAFARQMYEECTGQGFHEIAAPPQPAPKEEP